MSSTKQISLPRHVLIGKGVLKQIPNICNQLNLGPQLMIACDTVTDSLCAQKVIGLLEEKKIKTEKYVMKENNMDAAHELAASCDKELAIIAIGGGSVIDIAKAASKEKKIKFISVPTAASHDGIASPRASIPDKNKRYTIESEPPLAIIADIDVVITAPSRLFCAGCSDVIANYSAILDWKLAHRVLGEYYGDYAANLSLLSAEMIMRNASILAKKDEEGLRILLEALLSSSVAMSIAGSSRPCSGSEHLFSHAIDTLTENHALHGEQCGVGTILATYLHGTQWKNVRETLKTIGSPTTAEELGIDDEIVIKALVDAHKVRDRFTILSSINENAAKKAARVTGVI